MNEILNHGDVIFSYIIFINIILVLVHKKMYELTLIDL